MSTASFVFPSPAPAVIFSLFNVVFFSSRQRAPEQNCRNRCALITSPVDWRDAEWRKELCSSSLLFCLRRDIRSEHTSVRDSEKLLVEGHVSQRNDPLRRAEDFTSTAPQQNLGRVELDGGSRKSEAAEQDQILFSRKKVQITHEHMEVRRCASVANVCDCVMG